VGVVAVTITTMIMVVVDQRIQTTILSVWRLVPGGG
jgi:hypothetical protein